MDPAATIRPKVAIDPKKIIALRTKLELTQAALAKNAGLSQQDVARIETGGRTNPQVSTAERLASALGVTVDSLLDGKPASTKRRPFTRKGEK